MMPKHCFLGFLISFFLTGVAGTQPAHESLKPQRVQFQSRNFHNILQWQPGRALTGNSSVYFVQYKIYGQRQWKNKEDCWGTQELFCDLTSETSDIQEPYYGRVRAASAGSYSDWSMTPRFTPWWETKIDPPVMNITQVNGSLLVILHAPNLPQRYQKEKNISIEDYYELVYRVFIINNSLEKEQKVYEGAHRVVEIEALPPHSSYCVVAEIYQPMLDRRSQRSEERCVEMP
ncbi:interleukin-22 receptor subunit alpha-2 isoform X1 [Macaca nemestrina]|uniref:Interleukin-22 receptor subunit alpha-2 n=2 Tax=Macaca TaxID=9539 RepID=G7P328_MACFA|nr:interleukin-22 receptor subunit alpha-2 isoform X2 [Macaca fascicularis]XP_011712567.1 interleukin-22 receptor subunit alpha-2 isoform X1 [Macaca nemestrina]XP_014992847.1 interleukin-22 receptor subunit alpha-2 isoform X1 [Macaca mulatta]XP_050642605.1 interleukin-22 receptor subunit alpha-2 isoform X1 [Macaca thibetana thibetana]